MNVSTQSVLHSFSIKNIFCNKMGLTAFLFSYDEIDFESHP